MEKIVIDLVAKTDKATKEIEDLKKSIESLNKQIVDSNKDTADSLKNVEAVNLKKHLILYKEYW